MSKLTASENALRYGSASAMLMCWATCLVVTALMIPSCSRQHSIQTEKIGREGDASCGQSLGRKHEFVTSRMREAQQDSHKSAITIYPSLRNVLIAGSNDVGDIKQNYGKIERYMSLIDIHP
jgi:hypothetical protein